MNTQKRDYLWMNNAEYDAELDIILLLMPVCAVIVYVGCNFFGQGCKS
jgi:hypothetical protein